jgi:hypothetical protein
MVTYLSIPIFLLAAAGLLLTWRQWRHLLFLYLLIALTIGQCLSFYGSSRFRAPIEPILMLLVSGTFWWLQGFLKAKAYKSRGEDLLTDGLRVKKSGDLNSNI